MQLENRPYTKNEMQTALKEQGYVDSSSAAAQERSEIWNRRYKKTPRQIAAVALDSPGLAHPDAELIVDAESGLVVTPEEVEDIKSRREVGVS